MTAPEPQCVRLKRQGAEAVAKQLAGKSLRERLEFWRRQTEVLLAKQSASSRKPRRA
jgi:hypothetical protein